MTIKVAGKDHNTLMSDVGVMFFEGRIFPTQNSYKMSKTTVRFIKYFRKVTSYVEIALN